MAAVTHHAVALAVFHFISLTYSLPITVDVMNHGHGKLGSQNGRNSNLVRREKRRLLQQELVPASLLASGAKPAPAWSLYIANPPMTNYSHNVKTLGVSDWPQDYCIDFDVKLPDSDMGLQNGYAGAVALLGSVYLTAASELKLVSGSGIGFMALIQSDGDGPYYSTAGIGGFSSRHKAAFCYKQTTNEAKWIVDGGRAISGYKFNDGVPFPHERDVEMSVFTGSHTDDHEKMGTGAELWSLEIRPWYEWPCYRLVHDDVTSPILSTATLNSASFPQDYCVDFEVTLPTAASKEGTVVLLGTIQLVVSQGDKLHNGTALVPGGYGFLAKVQGSPDGPQFATTSVAAAGDRVKASFCYKADDLQPSWSVNGAPAPSDYTSGNGQPFPVDHDVPVTVMAGSHTDDQIEALEDGILHFLEINPWTLNAKAAGPADQGYPAGTKQ